jgi:putative ATPase
VPQTSLELDFADAAAPLAERLRPKTLDEVIGQRHLLGPGKPLRVAFESGRLHSMILWGPPGVGKTTLARLMADAFDAQFIAMSAVLGGVKDIRRSGRARAGGAHDGRCDRVFVDEVHRFNKSQRTRSRARRIGLFTFIGATTENPSFEVISGAALARHGARAEAARRRRPEDAAGAAHAGCSGRRRLPTRRASA